MKSPYGSISPPNGPDVADHVAVAAAERLARDLDRRRVDRGHVVGVAVAVQHDPRLPPNVLVRMQSEPASA